MSYIRSNLFISLETYKQNLETAVASETISFDFNQKLQKYYTQFWFYLVNSEC